MKLSFTYCDICRKDMTEDEISTWRPSLLFNKREAVFVFGRAGGDELKWKDICIRCEKELNKLLDEFKRKMCEELDKHEQEDDK